jgi:hypothetical protein
MTWRFVARMALSIGAWYEMISRGAVDLASQWGPGNELANLSVAGARMFPIGDRARWLQIRLENQVAHLQIWRIRDLVLLASRGRGVSCTFERHGRTRQSESDSRLLHDRQRGLLQATTSLMQ